jgi:hypothetical protein
MPTQRVSNGSPPTSPTPQRNLSPNRQYRNNRRSVVDYSPDRVAEHTTSGVGLLTAEFFGVMFLLVLELFVGTDAYEQKMLSIMKRGTLIAILFFLLAIIAGVGPNASKIAKGIGGLTFVGILLSSPGSTLIASMDKFFKMDWTGATQASADTGTSNATAGSAASTAASSSESALAKAEAAAQLALNVLKNLGGIL